MVRINALGQVIRVSPQHRIHVRDRDFIEVCQLKPGDEFLSDDGRWLPVDSIEDRGEVVPVYNFRLEGYHTYFVGSPEWGFSLWAHNAACLPIEGRAPHGSPGHNDPMVGIARSLAELAKKGKISGLRMNQALVDAAGKTISRLRPDLQYFKKGIKYIIEFNKSGGSNYHNERKLVFKAIFGDGWKGYRGINL